MNNKTNCCGAEHIHHRTAQEITAAMPDDDALIDLAELFKVFGDSTRIKLLTALSSGELCVCELSETVGMSSSAVSHQLKILKQAKLVGSRREGKTVYYFLADDHVMTILKQGIEHISE